MIYSQILTSIILIVSGFLAKKYPNLIAGYNSKSQVEKEKININALSLFLKQLLVSLGVFTILTLCVSLLAKFNIKTTLAFNVVLILLGVFIGLIYVNTNKKFKN